MLLAWVSMTVMGQETKTISCSTMTTTIPASWITKTDHLAGLGKMVTITDTANDPQYIFVLAEYNFSSADLSHTFERLFVNSNYDLFTGAKMDNTKYTTIDGYRTIKADYSKIYMEARRQCTACCFSTEKNTYMLLFMRKEGMPDLSVSVIESLKIDVSKSSINEFANAREEMKAFHDNLVSKNGFGRPLNEMITLENIDVSDQEDMLIFDFSTQMIKLDELTNEEAAELQRSLESGMLAIVKELSALFSSAQRCIDEGFGAIVTITDVNKKALFTKRYPNDMFR